MRTFKKLLRLLTTGSVSLFIAACYGAPVEYGDVETTIRVTNADGQPVAGLRVNTGGYYSTEYYYTNEAGEAVFYPIEDPESDGFMDATVKDIDGEENLGCFSPTLVSLGQEAFHEIVATPSEFTYSQETRTCRFVTETGEPIPCLKVNLCESGCNLDEFITDENGEVVFHPLLNPDGQLEPIFVSDKDGTAELGYFGKLIEVPLTDDPVMEVVLVAEAPAEPPAESTAAAPAKPAPSDEGPMDEEPADQSDAGDGE